MKLWRKINLAERAQDIVDNTYLNIVSRRPQNLEKCPLHLHKELPNREEEEND